MSASSAALQTRHVDKLNARSQNGTSCCEACDARDARPHLYEYPYFIHYPLYPLREYEYS
eukprot:scaffold232086_cov19-Prasinocladus_malaysianus.AAC.1